MRLRRPASTAPIREAAAAAEPLCQTRFCLRSPPADLRSPQLSVQIRRRPCLLIPAATHDNPEPAPAAATTRSHRAPPLSPSVASCPRHALPQPDAAPALIVAAAPVAEPPHASALVRRSIAPSPNDARCSPEPRPSAFARAPLFRPLPLLVRRLPPFAGAPTPAAPHRNAGDHHPWLRTTTSCQASFGRKGRKGKSN
ncbi:hypothetical protein EUGRSUZ_E01396 [Eucalyptus grandis]|uniref:Uncharacterized protein n=2 Tax=Eucalyptus grandis TaxID=71139 RepID=A0ACC3KWE5_EUCGR|nr:hypothetical protein EUGRSUZ_E01396 [Eucalyptus grandis]